VTVAVNNGPAAATEAKPKRGASTWIKCKHCLYRAKKQATMDEHVRTTHPDVVQQVFVAGTKSK
jgi:hypothetical protein